MEHYGTNPPPSDMTLSHQITERISRGKDASVVDRRWRP
jgi:hypothetical protein